MPDLHFQVAIVGGGMIGLVCAAVLTQAGIQVDLFESASKFGEVGAGIGLGPNAVRALDAMGLLKAVLAKSDQEISDMRAFRFMSCSPGHEHILDYPYLPEDNGLGIHRADFLDALIPFVDPNTTHFNKRCTNVASSSNAGTPHSILHFTDGTTFATDLVLGADGIRSTIRSVVLGIPGPEVQRLSFANTVAYRALIPLDDVKRAGVKTDLSARPICWTSLHKHIITFPIHNMNTINVVVFSSNPSIPMGSVQVPSHQWVILASNQEILDAYKDCGPDVTTLLSLMESPRKWSIHTVDPPLDTFVRENIALVGDAAHAMCPHLGAGAGQGIEDSFVLTRLLSHPHTKLSNLRDVLQAYNEVRLERANMVVRGSIRAGKIYECGLPSQQMHEALVNLWEPVWHHDLQEDVSSAVRLLKEKGVFVMNPL
ncbi:hypothetical protein SERLADRAFT_453461 [Serpula lacrymans var. lacrymans S7.9]|uniref:FAD-binding domain-containing protein n=1 Tax=Serpula lacrymans var. lacrymans (strain S7.9) TaxID=578457 RepID=F8PB53_SERL9|nr:uncharacterized protein SERLADRAFT_453461 [Serpula lacrymans var. lacrymans S7.9]EGO19493.1 hypothetical protein SERLADRAFT_453461 [Serpula lacrymans var. lacrymans S7.9]